MQEGDTVFDKLQEGQLSGHWYDWLTLPFRIVFWPIRALAMRFIAPASWGKDQKDEFILMLTKEIQTYTSHKNIIETSQQYTKDMKYLTNITHLEAVEYYIAYYEALRSLLMQKSQDNTYKELQIYTMASQSFTTKKIDYAIPRNSKCSMILAKNDDIQGATENRKLVISFGGNGESAEGQIYSLSNITKKVNNDFLAVSYPLRATSSSELIDAGKSAILRAINAGYKAENITIVGHSLGGAVSAKILQEMKPYLKGLKFAGYVNHRSFTKLGDAAYELCKTRPVDDTFGNNLSNAHTLRERTRAAWGAKFLNGLLWCLGLQLDAERVFQDSQLPVEQMKFYADNKDRVIKHGASMAGAMYDIQTTIPTRIKITPKYDHDNQPSNSILKESKSHNQWEERIKAKQQPKYSAIITKNNSSQIQRDL